jgi:hypothetical protein
VVTLAMAVAAALELALAVLMPREDERGAGIE